MEGYDIVCFFYLSPQDEENTSLAGRVKELEEERGRLHRTNAAQATQLDKFKKIAEDSKGKAESLETQLTANKKVISSPRTLVDIERVLGVDSNLYIPL